MHEDLDVIHNLSVVRAGRVKMAKTFYSADFV
jgi:hypothetical protein